MITRITAENYLGFVFIMGAIHNSPSSMFQGKGIDTRTCNNYTKTKNINVNQLCLFYFLTVSCIYSILCIITTLMHSLLCQSPLAFLKFIFHVNLFHSPGSMVLLTVPWICYTISHFKNLCTIILLTQNLYYCFTSTLFFFFLLSYPNLSLNTERHEVCLSDESFQLY